MHTLINAAFSRRSAVIMILMLLLFGGMYSYVIIAKEAAPDIEIPFFMVNIAYPGISPEDSARLLVRPMEREMQGLEGLRRLTSLAGEGFAHIQLEFDPGADHQQALIDVRDAVEFARGELPPGAEEPRVRELDISLFPVVTATLSGMVSERALISIARDLRDRIETLPGVLEVEVAGKREDLVEILVDPLAVESYGISYEEVAQAVQRNNQLIAAGALASGAGRIPVIIPGVIEDIEDILNTAVLVRNGTVVTLEDLATVRQTFEDPTNLARINGEPAVALEIRKTAGANVIETVNAAQALIDEESQNWPEAIRVNYLQNQAEDIEDLLGDLENNVLLAVILVILTIILALGVRSSLLVGLAIPGAFLSGILTVYLIGFTLNIVVLFALILVIGMLVDGAIVVVERAKSHMESGWPATEAFRKASIRMAWPVTASVSTTLAVFVPLLFWPGTAGQFMRFLPATVLITLIASLAMALIFLPVLGSILSRKDSGSDESRKTEPEAADSRLIRSYLFMLDRFLPRPGLVLAGIFSILILMYMAYMAFGKGVDFFPEVEPQFARIQIQTQGNFSIWEADALVREVENPLIGLDEIEVVYARAFTEIEQRMGTDLPEDTIGTIRLDLVDWRLRRPAEELIRDLRDRVDIPGLAIQIREQERGPGVGMPIEIEVAGPGSREIVEALDQIQELMAEVGGFIDVTDDRPLAGIELRLAVDRSEAARYGADVAMLGSAVQLLTEGLLLGTYHPDYVDEEVDLRLRFHPPDRNVGELANLRVLTHVGLVPITNFVNFEPVPLTGLVTMVDGRRVHTINADAAPGELVSERVDALREALEQKGLGPGIDVRFRGQVEDQAEAGSFLISAFLLAVFLMFLILVLQFNSLFQALLVMSAIVFSTAGVLLGLMVRQEAFSIIMSGMGIIALAGIVVNNNIVLIDAYNEYLGKGLKALDAARKAGRERFRPVLLTAVTTIVGLTPMSLGLTIDFMARDAYLGSPSTQYWIQLATAVIGGLAISTLVTMFFTPTMLAWRDRLRE